MATCRPNLSSDILNDACAIPAKGLVKNGKSVLIARSDIDFSATTVADGVITDLILKPGTSGNNIFHAQSLANSSSAWAYSEDSYSGFTQSYSGRISFPLGTSPSVIKSLANDYVIVIDTNQVNETKYKVLGLDAGLTLKESTWNTNEEFASILFTLGTADGNLESEQFWSYFKTDLATSTIEFEAKFVPQV